MSNIILKDKTGVAKTYENVLAIKVPNTSSNYATYMEGVGKPEQEKTTDPGTSAVIVTPDDGYTLSKVTVNAMPEGSATTPATTITSNPAITWDNTNNVILASHSGNESITPTVVPGYVANGTSGTVTTSGSSTVSAELLQPSLAAVNVKDGVTIFNTTGTFTNASTITGEGKTAAATANILTGKAAFLDGAQINGTMANNGATGTTITAQGGTYTIPEGYTTGGTVTADITATTLDNTIISGQAFEEATGDYGWRSTVTVPAGYHNAQTLTKDFSDILPAPTTEGTASEMLLGYQLYDHKGKVITGTMPNNGATTGTISTQGGTFTIPAGYHNGEGVITATLPSGSVSNPTATKGTVSNNSITVTPSVASSTGYITGETKNGTSVTVAASELVSGNKSLSSGTSPQTDIDVTNYATVSISAIESGTAGTPIATKGTVSSNSVTVTPSVTNTTGYITGSTINGTPVTVTAAELVSGNKSLDPSTSAQTGIDVANYSTVSISAIPTTTHANPTAAIDNATGVVTASHTQTTGYVEGGTTTGTLNLPTQGAATITPNSVSQTAVVSGKYTTGAVIVAAVPTESPASITANGTYNATSGTYWTGVTVAIPVYDGSVS